MKKLTVILLIVVTSGLTAHSLLWARGGGHGNSIGSPSGGGGHIRGGGGGGSHFGGGHRHFGGGNHHFRGGHRHFGHRHNRYNFNLGFGGFYGPGFFGPSFYGPGFYGYPYYYGYRSFNFYPRGYGYSSPVIASSPPVYIQKEVQTKASTQPPSSYWYYCRNPEGYYPYVRQCSEGWLQVAPQPAPQSAPQ